MSTNQSGGPGGATVRLSFPGRYPAPPARELRHPNAALLDRYLDTWTTAFGPLNHEEGADFEHFVEMAARFDAALGAFDAESAVIDNESEVRHGDTFPDTDFMFGPLSTWYGSEHYATGSADTYWANPAFRELSGRRWDLAGLFPENPASRDVVDVLKELYDDGVRDYVVKGTASKTLLTMFRLEERPTSLFSKGIPEDIYHASMHLEGSSDVFLVQERLPLAHEYRIFMAGDTPAAGAGCIEHFTPLDGRGDAFDTRLEGTRGSGIIVDDPALTARLVGFARTAGAALFRADPGLGDAWVVDVAINTATAEPVVIEVNPGRNSGLYASAPNLWMEAVHAMLTGREQVAA